MSDTRDPNWQAVDERLAGIFRDANQELVNAVRQMQERLLCAQATAERRVSDLLAQLDAELESVELQSTRVHFSEARARMIARHSFDQASAQVASLASSRSYDFGQRAEFPTELEWHRLDLEPGEERS